MTGSKINGERQYYQCQKNPGHRPFIPVNQFTPQHLPDDAQDDDALQYIKINTELTARIKVDSTSARPGEADHPGSGSILVGTGRVVRVQPGEGRFPVARTKQPRRNPWWCVDILTARNIIYDAQEARVATAALFYDDEDSLKDGRAQFVKGVWLRGSNHWGVLRCVTGDKALAERLMELLNRLSRLNFARDSGNAVVIVSHPHGMCKKLTVGELTRDNPGPGGFDMGYSADTCTGSGGAPVLSIGKGGLRQLAVHTGTREDDSSNSGAAINVERALALEFGRRG